MSLLIELCPKLVLNFKKDDFNYECNFKTGDLYKVLKSYNLSYNLLFSYGGNFGKELYDHLRKNYFKTIAIETRDNSSLIVNIYDGKTTISKSSPDQVLTLIDYQKIMDEFVSAIYNENTIVLPIYDTEESIAYKIIKIANNYYKSTIVFGDKAHKFLKHKPTIAIFMRKQVEDICPFKILDDYELLNFSYSLAEDTPTRIIIIDEDILYFYKTGVCYKATGIKTNFTKTLFAAVFATENNMDSYEIAQFIASANNLPLGTKIGTINEKSKEIKMGIFRRWRNSVFCI